MIRQRGGSLEVVVYQGRDPVTGRSKKVSRTVRGTDKDARLRARQVELDLMGEAHEGRVRDGAGATLDQLIDRWLATTRVEESTRYQARHALDKHVRPALGKTRLSRLRAEDLDDLYVALERRGRRKTGLSASSVRRLHGHLRSVLNLGVKLRWIARNPAEDASPPPEGHSEPVAPSTEAIQAFIAAIADEPEIATFVRLGAVTGMRRAEVCALRRSDVDLDSGELRIVRALGLGSGAPYVKSTKTGAKHAIALDGATCDLLRVHLKAQDELATAADTTVGRDGYLFSLEVDASRPMRPDYVTKRLRAWRVKLAKRREQDASLVDVSAVTLRSLRHWMGTQGADAFGVKATQGRGGWARGSTLLDRYAAHLPPSDLALARHLGGLLDGAPEGGE